MKAIIEGCEICGKKITRNESLMTSGVMICSIECKTERKKRLPKRTTIVSVDYWLSKGYSEQDAIEQVSIEQRKRSRRCVEHYQQKGFSIEESKEKVSEYQRKLSKRNSEMYTIEEKRLRSRFSAEYWISKGYNEEEAKAIIRKNSDTSSLSYFTNKLGKEEGTKRYNDTIKRRRENYNLAAYINKHGEEKGTELWHKKYKNRHDSKAANEFFSRVVDELDNDLKIYASITELGEYGVNDSGKYYLYDMVIPEIELCIEFNGDYWHCNPSKYNASYFHAQTKKTAKEIWEHDTKKIQAIKKLRGFDTITVWESEANSKINEIITEIQNVQKSKN